MCEDIGNGFLLHHHCYCHFWLKVWLWNNRTKTVAAVFGVSWWKRGALRVFRSLCSGFMVVFQRFQLVLVVDYWRMVVCLGVPRSSIACSRTGVVVVGGVASWSWKRSPLLDCGAWYSQSRIRITTDNKSPVCLSLVVVWLFVGLGLPIICGLVLFLLYNPQKQCILLMFGLPQIKPSPVWLWPEFDLIWSITVWRKFDLIRSILVCPDPICSMLH